MPLKSVVYRLLIYKENSTNCYFSIYLLGWETLVIITKIADYESNYIKKAGLLEGDEIIAINEITIKMIYMEEDAELSRQDTLVYDIVRQGKSYKIPVVIDRNEVQGD